MKMFGAIQPSEMGKIVAQVGDGGSVQYLVPAPPVQPAEPRLDAPLIDALFSDPPAGGWDSNGEYHPGISAKRRPVKGEPIDLPDYDRIMSQIEHKRGITRSMPNQGIRD